MCGQTTGMCCVGRDAWKRKYFEEKRKTVPLEEESRRLVSELDANHQKIIAQLERAHDGQHSSATPAPERVRRVTVKFASLDISL